jgi:hypothetical protein
MAVTNCCQLPCSPEKYLKGEACLLAGAKDDRDVKILMKSPKRITNDSLKLQLVAYLLIFFYTLMFFCGQMCMARLAINLL